MYAVWRLIGSGILAIVLGIMLYQVPEIEWYKPLPAFVVAPFLIGLGLMHWSNLKNKPKQDL